MNPRKPRRGQSLIPGQKNPVARRPQHAMEALEPRLLLTAAQDDTLSDAWKAQLGTFQTEVANLASNAEWTKARDLFGTGMNTDSLSDLVTTKAGGTIYRVQDLTQRALDDITTLVSQVSVDPDPTKWDIAVVASKLNGQHVGSTNGWYFVVDAAAATKTRMALGLTLTTPAKTIVKGADNVLKALESEVGIVAQSTDPQKDAETDQPHLDLSASAKVELRGVLDIAVSKKTVNNVTSLVFDSNAEVDKLDAGAHAILDEMGAADFRLGFVQVDEIDDATETAPDIDASAGVSMSGFNGTRQIVFTSGLAADLEFKVTGSVSGWTQSKTFDVQKSVSGSWTIAGLDNAWSNWKSVSAQNVLGQLQSLQNQLGVLSQSKALEVFDPSVVNQKVAEVADYVKLVKDLLFSNTSGTDADWLVRVGTSGVVEKALFRTVQELQDRLGKANVLGTNGVRLDSQVLKIDFALGGTFLDQTFAASFGDLFDSQFLGAKSNSSFAVSGSGKVTFTLGIDLSEGASLAGTDTLSSLRGLPASALGPDGAAAAATTASWSNALGRQQVLVAQSAIPFQGSLTGDLVFNLDKPANGATPPSSTKITVARDATNATLTDLVADINAQLAATGVTAIAADGAVRLVSSAEFSISANSDSGSSILSELRLDTKASALPSAFATMRPTDYGAISFGIAIDGGAVTTIQVGGATEQAPLSIDGLVSRINAELADANLTTNYGIVASATNTGVIRFVQNKDLLTTKTTHSFSISSATAIGFATTTASQFTMSGQSIVPNGRIKSDATITVTGIGAAPVSVTVKAASTQTNSNILQLVENVRAAIAGDATLASALSVSLQGHKLVFAATSASQGAFSITGTGLDQLGLVEAVDGVTDNTSSKADLDIRLSDGSRFVVSMASLTATSTVQNAVDAIVAASGTTPRISATVTAKGIRIVDLSGGNGSFTIASRFGSQIGSVLGIEGQGKLATEGGVYRPVLQGGIIKGMDIGDRFSISDFNAVTDLVASIADITVNGATVAGNDAQISDSTTAIVLGVNDPIGPKNAGQYATIGGVLYKILRVDVVKELDASGVVVTNPDGSEKVLSRTLVIETPHAAFSAAHTSAFSIFLDGVQVSATAGPLGVYLLGNGSLGRRITLDASGSINLSQLANWIAGVDPTTVSTQFSIGAITDGATPPNDVHDSMTFRVLAEGLDTLQQVGTIDLDFNGNLVQATPHFDTGAINFTDHLDKIRNITLQDVLDNIGTIATYVETLTGKDVFQQEIPGTGKKVADLLHVVEEINEVVRDLRGNGGATLYSLEHRLEQLMGLAADQFKMTLENVTVAGVAHKALRLKFDFSRDLRDTSNFSFGNGGTIKIGGGATLNTSGSADLVLDFGLLLDTISTSNPVPDLVVFQDTDLVVEADVSGTDLKFNLGMSGIPGLNKLLQVESKDGIPCAFHFSGDFSAGLTTDVTDIADLGNAGVVDLDATGNVGATLPVYVAGTSLGTLKLGMWKSGALSIYDGSDDTKGVIDGAIAGFQVRPNTTDTMDNDKATLDVSEFYEKITDLANMNLGLWDTIKLGVDGLDMALEALQSSMDDNFSGGKLNIPVISGALDGSSDFLADLRLKLVEPFREFVNSADQLDEKTVAKWLNTELEKLGVLKTWNSSLAWGGGTTAWTRSTTQKVGYRMDGDKAEWAFTLGGSWDVGKGFGLDLGMPGLGFKTEGGVSASLSWTLNLGFGISATEGFYLIAPKGDELVVKLDAGLTPGSTFKGSLGFLEMGIRAGQSAIVDANADLYLDINDANNSKTETRVNDAKTDKADHLGLGTLSRFNPDVYIESSVTIDLPLELGIIGTLPDSGKDSSAATPAFPNLQADFEFKWTYPGGIEKVGFDDVAFNLGSYVSKVLMPVIEQIQEIVEPIRPVLDFLTSPIPVLSDIRGEPITMLDLAKLVDPDINVGMIQDLKDLVDMLDSLKSFGTGATADQLAWDLGDFWFVNNVVAGDRGAAGGESASALNDKGMNFLKGGASSSAISQLTTKLGSKNEQHLKDATTVGKKQITAKGSGWHLPIVEKPQLLLGLLMGQNVDLVTYDLRPLSFDFTWSQFYPIVGPIGARISLTMGADIDLAFGYDTLGIKKFIESDYNDPLALIDGFYVADLAMDGNGVPSGADIPEVVLHGGLSAAAELNLGIASGGVGGGLNVEVDFNLNDPDRDGRVRLTELAENFLNEWENNEGFAKASAPLAIFDISGEIYAEFYAYVDTWLWSERWQITDPITIATFEIPFSRPARMAHKVDDDLVLNIGPNSEGRLNGNLTDSSDDVEVEIQGNNVYVTSKTFGVSKKQTYTVGSTGKIYIDAGNGNDKIVVKGQSSHDIEVLGGKGDDTIDFAGYTNNGGQILLAGQEGGDKIKGAIAGTGGYQVLLGGDGRLSVDGDERIQQIVVRTGGDSDGVDTITGGSADDLIVGGTGGDILAGGEGADIIVADGGRMIRSGSTWIVDRTEFDSMGGNDTVWGDAGADVIYAGAGSDRVDGGADNDVIHGQDGDDLLVGGSGIDTVLGGKGADTILGDQLAADVDLATLFPRSLSGHGSKIAAFSTDHKDSGNAGNDILDGGIGNDIVFGDSAGDTGGNDVIRGGEDNDYLSGDGGADQIGAGMGEDVLQGGLGADTLDGGEGDDIVFGDKGYYGLSGKGASDLVAAKQEKVYGDKLAGEFQINASTTSADGSADAIVAGMGSDYIDGQGGGDTVNILFRGGDNHSVTTVRDTGTDISSDAVKVLGTLAKDQILVRAGANALGSVMLLPEAAPEANNPYPVKTALERVNFIGQKGSTSVGVEKLVVDGSIGDDRIALDGTVAATSIQGGSGNDTIQVGQMFRSKRTGTDKESTETSPFLGVDESVATITTSKGELSKGVSHVTTVSGGFGNDTITVLHNDAPLSAFGNEGDDTFQVQSFRTPTQELVPSAPANIDGGLGVDKFALAGTEGDDTFYITRDGILADGVSTSVSGVENMSAEAGAGDDTFHVLGTKADTTTVIHGGLGSDTVIQGGLATSMPIRSMDLRGHSGLISHEVIAAEGTSYANVTANDLKVNVVDNEGQPTVVFVNSSNLIVDPVLNFKEGSTGSYYLRLSHALAGTATKTVTISVPELSDEAVQAGDRGFQVSLDNATWTDSVDVVFGAATDAAKGIKAWNSRVAIYVRAASDRFREAGIVSSFVNHSMKDGSSQIRSIAVNTYAGSSTTDAYKMGFTRDVLVAADSTGAVPATIEVAIGAWDRLEGVWWKAGGSITGSTVVTKADGTKWVTIPTGGKVGAVQVHTSANRVAVKGANSVALSYLETSSSNMDVYYYKENSTTPVRLAKVGAARGTTDSNEYSWFQDGKKIVFISIGTGKIASLSGSISLSKGERDIPALVSSLPGGSDPVNTTVPEVQIVQTGTSTDVTELGLVDTYQIKLSTPPAAGETVVVRIRPQVTQWGSGATQKSRQVDVTVNGVSSTGKEYIDVTFTDTSYAPVTVTVKAVNDSNPEADDFSFVAASTSTLDAIDGSVWAEGDGGFTEFSTAAPLMVRHGEFGTRHFKDETNEYANVAAGDLGLADATSESFTLTVAKTDMDAQLTSAGIESGVAAPTLAELDDGMWAILFTAGTTELGKPSLIKGAVENGVATITLDRNFRRILDDKGVLVPVTWKLVRVSPKSFVQEADQVDRMFIEDNDNVVARQGALDRVQTARARDAAAGVVTTPELDALAIDYASRMDAQRFSGYGLHAAGLNWGDFEVAQVDLGSNVDTLAVSAAQARPDGFQTLTIVNAGKGDDSVVVSSLRSESVAALATGTLEAVPTRSTTGDRQVVATISSDLAANLAVDHLEGLFLVAKSVNGGEQRREILASRVENGKTILVLDGEFSGTLASMQVSLVGAVRPTWTGALEAGALAGSTMTLPVATRSASDAPQAGDILEVVWLDSVGAVAVSRHVVATADASIATVEGVFGEDVIAGAVEFRFLRPVGDGLLAINAQDGDDTIDASSDAVARSVVLFGGLGDDTLTVNSDAYAFGDRGQVRYEDETTKAAVTLLGSTDGGSDDTTPATVGEHQTDGVRREPVLFRTMDDDKGGEDEIRVKGDRNVVFGGAGTDTITILDNANGSASGNVAFGDGGQIDLVATTASGVELRRGDDAPARITKAQTKNNDIGSRDEIRIGNGDNTVFGGVGGDSIVAGNGNSNILGDGGEIVYHARQDDITKAVALEIRTMDDDQGGNDTIQVGDGSDNILGGAGDDLIVAGDGNSNIAGDAGEILFAVRSDDVSKVRLSKVATKSPGIGGDDVIKVGDGNSNVFGGYGADLIRTGDGNTNAAGDNGEATFAEVATDASKVRLVRIETTSDDLGGTDTIFTGDGANNLFGGTSDDAITSGSGDDVIVGDGGYIQFNADGERDRVSDVGRDLGGADIIHAGIGRNTVFGGLGADVIATGVDLANADVRAAHSDDKDVVVGDNGYRTFQGVTDDSEVRLQTTMSFNFQGQAQNGIASGKYAGIGEFRTTNWNNIAGPLVAIGPSTYGNDSKEIILNSEGERMAGLELSYGGKENHRTDSIEFNAYSQENYDATRIPNPSGVVGGATDADGWLFAGGVRTSGNNDHLGNKLEVEMDGLSEYFESYTVVVYIDAPNNVSTPISNAPNESIRAISNGSKTFYIDDSADPNNPAFHNFRGTYIRATETSAATAKGKWANYVVFEGMTDDRFVVNIKDGVPNANYNGLDIPSIAGIQIVGKYRRQNVVATSTSELGGNDAISTSGGNDIVLGGAGSDAIATFGDIRQGVQDFDVVFGDNAKVVEMDHAQRAEADPFAAWSTGFDANVPTAGVGFDDTIVTGNGNDVVLGGSGSDRIDTQRHDDLAATVATGEAAIPEALGSSSLTALQDWSTQGLDVLSLNLSYTGRDSSIIDADLNVASGQVAGAVAAKNWNNLIVRDDLSVPVTIAQNLVSSAGSTVSGVKVGIQTRNVRNPSSISFAMGDHYYGHNEIDPDSDNARMFESSLWAQKQDQVEVNITGISNFAGTGTYDVYVYIDGDNQRTAGDDYAFEVAGNGTKYYLNDWQGNTFNGEFRRVTMQNPGQAPNVGVTPDGRMVGNYVVFKNVTGTNFALVVKNYWMNDQSPLSQPSISAIQIVKGAPKDSLPLNGDYDKDVVLGDSGKVRFDLDVPYGVIDDVVGARNKPVEAVSYAGRFDGAADWIVTGRNKDLVFGGDGADRIDSGVGGDVVLGDNGRTLMTDYNPIGVRPATNLSILDNQVQDNSVTIGGTNYYTGGFQSGSLVGVILAPSAQGGADLIDAGQDNDLVYGQEGSDSIVLNEGAQDVAHDSGSDLVLNRSGVYASLAAYQSDLTGILAKLDNAGDRAAQAFASNDFGSTQSLGSLALVPPTPVVPPTTLTGALSTTGLDVDLAAGQEIVLSASTWPAGDAALDIASRAGTLPGFLVTVENAGVIPWQYAGGTTSMRIDELPESGPYTIRLKAVKAASLTVKLASV